MMNKQIRRMIDEIFADMKMTADNLALRDELMANAQARFEDSVRTGKTEEEAFAEVAASLGDVQSLLREMNAEKPEDSAEGTAQTETQTQRDETAEGEEAGADEPDFEVKTEKTPDVPSFSPSPTDSSDSAKRWARLSARWATWASRLCRRRRSWFGRWTT